MSNRFSMSLLISSALGLYRSSKEDRGSQLLRRSSVPSLESISIFIPSDFHEVHAWTDRGFRKVWMSEEKLALITYCEGDVCISTFDDLDTFSEAVTAADTFYERMAA